VDSVSPHEKIKKKIYSQTTNPEVDEEYGVHIKEGENSFEFNSYNFKLCSRNRPLEEHKSYY
jgi:hypothetical protein